MLRPPVMPLIPSTPKETIPMNNNPLNRITELLKELECIYSYIDYMTWSEYDSIEEITKPYG